MFDFQANFPFTWEIIENIIKIARSLVIISFFLGQIKVNNTSITLVTTYLLRLLSTVHN